MCSLLFVEILHCLFRFELLLFARVSFDGKIQPTDSVGQTATVVDAEAIEVPLTTGPEELTVCFTKKSIVPTFLDTGRRA